MKGEKKNFHGIKLKFVRKIFEIIISFYIYDKDEKILSFSGHLMDLTT